MSPHQQHCTLIILAGALTLGSCFDPGSDPQPWISPVPTAVEVTAAEDYAPPVKMSAEDEDEYLVLMSPLTPDIPRDDLTRIGVLENANSLDVWLIPASDDSPSMHVMGPTGKDPSWLMNTLMAGEAMWVAKTANDTVHVAHYVDGKITATYVVGPVHNAERTTGWECKFIRDTDEGVDVLICRNHATGIFYEPDDDDLIEVDIGAEN